MAWLAAIALDLVTTGHYLDVAARDLVMATGAYALARLAPGRETSRADVRAGSAEACWGARLRFDGPGKRHPTDQWTNASGKF